MRKRILLLFVCLCLYKANAANKEINTEDILKKDFSSVFTFKNDSLLKLRFAEISKLRDNKEYANALRDALKLLDEVKSTENIYWRYKINYLIGDIWQKRNKYSEALDFYKNSLKLLYTNRIDSKKKVFTNVDLAKSLLKVGGAYHNLSAAIDMTKKYDYRDSIKLVYDKNRFKDSAIVYYDKLEKFPILNNQVDNIKAQVFNNFSTIYEADSSFSKAKNYINKAIKIYRRSNNNIKLASSLNNLANIYLSQKNYQKAKEIYTEALELIKNDNNSKTIRVKASLYFNLAWAMRNLEEFEAYDFQEKSYDIMDNIRKKEFDVILEEVVYKYDFDGKKALLLKEQENKRLRDQQVFGIIGILALIIIISLAYTIKLKNLKEKNNILLKNQEIEKVKSESQTRMLNVSLDVKEAERKEIAEILHDNVSAMLSAANMHLQVLTKQFDGSKSSEIDKTHKIIDETSVIVRDLSHNLVSSLLLKFGLAKAVSDKAETFSNSILTIDTEIHNIRRYSQSFEMKVFNMIKEFLNNIIKHSKAENALVELQEKNGTLFITISDDGVGFDKTKINFVESLGIIQIQARIQMMDGKFHIESSKNNGTIISIEIPVLEPEETNLV